MPATRIGKGDFCRELAAIGQVPIAEAERQYETWMNLTEGHLAAGHEISFPYGTLRTQRSEARTGVNPRNPEERIAVKAMTRVRLRPSSSFTKNVLNGPKRERDRLIKQIPRVEAAAPTPRQPKAAVAPAPTPSGADISVRMADLSARMQAAQARIMERTAQGKTPLKRDLDQFNKLQGEWQSLTLGGVKPTVRAETQKRPSARGKGATAKGARSGGKQVQASAS